MADFRQRNCRNRFARYIQTISGNETVRHPHPTPTLSSGGPTGGKTATRAYHFVPKNSNFLPPTVNTDMRVARGFKIHERLRTELSIEAFNLFNHVNYNTATGAAYSTGGTAAAPTLTYSSSFGALTAANNGTIFTARQLQLGAKISVLAETTARSQRSCDQRIRAYRRACVGGNSIAMRPVR